MNVFCERPRYGYAAGSVVFFLVSVSDFVHQWESRSSTSPRPPTAGLAMLLNIQIVTRLSVTRNHTYAIILERRYCCCLLDLFSFVLSVVFVFTAGIRNPRSRLDRAPNGNHKTRRYQNNNYRVYNETTTVRD